MSQSHWISPGLAVCIAYGLVSMSISLAYKALLSSYAYNGKYIMLAAQMALSLMFSLAAKKHIAHIPGMAIPDVSVPALKRSILPGVLFVVNIVVGWYGLQLVPIPMFLAVRRTTTAFTLLAEYFILKKVAGPSTQLSVAFIVLGALIAGYPSFTSDYVGFMYTIANNILTAIAMSVTKRFSDDFRFNAFGVVFYNSLIALPLCLVGALVTGEFEYTFSASTFPPGATWGFWASFLFASSLGCVMNVVVFLCSTINGPLITSITGNMKDILSTTVALAVFKDFVLNAYTATGLLVSFAGAGLFSWVKVQEIRASQAAQHAKQDPATERPVLVRTHGA